MDLPDPLYKEAVNIVIQHEKASASLLQRRLNVGYARAARLLDMLAQAGVVSVSQGAKPVDVLVSSPEEALEHLVQPQLQPKLRYMLLYIKYRYSSTLWWICEHVLLPVAIAYFMDRLLIR